MLNSAHCVLLWAHAGTDVDGQTDTIQFHIPCFASYAAIANNVQQFYIYVMDVLCIDILVIIYLQCTCAGGLSQIVSSLYVEFFVMLTFYRFDILTDRIRMANK